MRHELLDRRTYGGWRGLVRRGSALAVWLGVGACSVDQRQLTLSEDSADTGAGGEADHGASAGASAAGGSGSTAGGDGSGGASELVDGCADLDTDGVGDCRLTLLENATFTSDVASWTARADAALDWDVRNALDDLPSGSARLRSLLGRASAAQCVALEGRQLVIAYASALIDSSSDATTPPSAALQVSFFDGEHCAGSPSGFFETPPSTQLDSWGTLQAGGISSASTRSVAVELVSLKLDGALSLDVFFDNVMLRLGKLDPESAAD